MLNTEGINHANSLGLPTFTQTLLLCSFSAVWRKNKQAKLSLC